MKRKIELGCLIALTLLWLMVFCALVMAQGQQPFSRYQENSTDTLMMDSYSVIYSPALRIPINVQWTLSVTDMGSSHREPSWRFQEDERVAKPRATHDDYTHSGYDRGHMVPAADRSRNISSMKQTFIMTNVCPQVPALNRGAWKSLENACRMVAMNGTPVRIVADAVFWPADTQRIGRNGVAVPHGFVKTVYSSTTDSILYARYFQNW